MKNILLRDIMTKDPVTLNIDEPFCTVAEIFQKRDIRHLPIVNAQGQILGDHFPAGPESYCVPEEGA